MVSLAILTMLVALQQKLRLLTLEIADVLPYVRHNFGIGTNNFNMLLMRRVAL
jgi:hypothetical protein